ncbi:MAG: tetratricopeptide repeat protein [Elusimicrobia bacterium]|nr:tetratricopeptide repeat protein [Elusimicrobiota bacterium]
MALGGRKPYPWVSLIVFLIPFIFYIPTFQNSFLYGDDEELILRNAYLRDWKHLPELLTDQTRAGAGLSSNFYRPTQMTLYFLLVQTAGLVPWAFQLLNIALHAGGSLLFFLLLQRWLPASPLLSLSGVLLWALHPIHVEAVANINGTADPLALFLMLLSFWFFLCGRFKSAGLGYLLALLSKESAVILPLALVLYDRMQGQKENFLKRHRLFWVLAGLYLLLRLSLFNFAGALNFYPASNPFTENFSYRLYTLFSVLGGGFRMLCWPTGLYPEKGWPVFTTLWTPAVLTPLIVILGLLGAALYFSKRNPLVAFGILWFFVSYLPMSNLWAKINALFWEHWFYAPSLGLVLALLAGASRMRPKAQKLCALAMLFLALFLGPKTIRQIGIWKDPEIFGRTILQYERGSARVWNNYAMALMDAEKHGEAILAYRKAIGTSDVYPQTHHNLANLYRKTGNLPAAAREYQRALEIDPRFYFSRVALGELLIQTGREEAGVQQLREALEIYPHLPQVRSFLNSVPLKKP